LTATVPKRDSGITYVMDESIHKSPQEMESLFLLREDMDTYTSFQIPMTQNLFQQRLCDQNSPLCCDFKLNVTLSNVQPLDVHKFKNQEK
jgi:hypothetical protein